MALFSMSSIGLIAVTMGFMAVGSLWSERDQRAIDAQSAERQVLGTACFAAKSEGETGSVTAPSSAYLSCQASFQAYSAHASWEALARAAGR